MRKIILSLAAMFCLTTAAFAAAGDKVYFVDSQNWGALYVTEYDDSWNAQYGTAVSEGWQYGGKDVYVYTIQSDASTTVSVKLDDSHYTNPAIAIEAGCYYTIDAGGGYYWHTKYYYNEFYFMDNNSSYEFGVTPNIVLATSEWSLLNGESWDGQPMISIGMVTMNESTYPAWKYVYLTTAEVEKVQFLKSTDTSVKINADVEAGKKFYSWWTWYTTINEIANPIRLVGDGALLADNWNPNVDASRMWWDNTESVFKANYPSVFVAAGDYSFRAYLGAGDNCWNAPFPHSNAASWHESVNIASTGVYTLDFAYNPATDALTCTATPVENYARNVTSGNYGTMCLPRASVSWTGATFYKVAGKEMDGSDIASIVLEEVTNGWLEAGRPYVFKATDEWVNVYFNSEDAASTPITTENNGLVGSFTTTAIDAYDGTSCYNYILSGNQFYRAGSDVFVGALRAYLNMDDVPTVSGASLAPGRKYVRMGVEGYNAPTAVDNVQGDDVQCTKVLRDGQLIIIRDGVQYNAIGTRMQ